MNEEKKYLQMDFNFMKNPTQERAPDRENVDLRLLRQGPENCKKWDEIAKSVELMFLSRNLENIIRFSTRNKIVKQDVAQHSFNVVFLFF